MVVVAVVVVVVVVVVAVSLRARILGNVQQFIPRLRFFFFFFTVEISLRTLISLFTQD